MTAPLARAARDRQATTIPAAEGVTERACRDVLARMAQIAQADGTMRYGLSATKLAEMTGYSVRTVKRAQAVLVAANLLERERQGGGHASTKWRVTLPVEAVQTPTDRMAPGHTWGAALARLTRHAGTALDPAHGQSGGSSSPATATDYCHHGGIAGLDSSGLARCPMCRRESDQQTARLTVVA